MSITDDDKKEGASSEAGSEGVRAPIGGPYGILFPPDITVWNEARRLIGDNVRVEDLAVCASQDPSIVIELIRTANALFFAVGKSPITSVRTAIVRLGSQVVLELLEKMKDRPRFEDPEVCEAFESQRNRCKRTAIIARMLAETLTRTLGDDCHTAGLFYGLGELLAVAHLREHYVKLAEDLSRSAVAYRLAQDYRFDIEKMGLNYLRKYGIPEVLLFALDRESRPPSSERAIMKPICQAAVELVDAFEANKWEKLAPGKPLPPKSPLRSLQVPEAQYLKLYERATEYLHAAKALEERQRSLRKSGGISFDATLKTDEPAQEEIQPKVEPTPDDVEQDSANEGGELKSEIDSLLREADKATEEVVALEEGVSTEPPPQPASKSRPQTTITTMSEVLKSGEDQFSILATRSTTKTVPRVQQKDVQPRVAPPTLVSERGSKVVGEITSMLDGAKSSEELLSSLLDMLVKDGCFKKSALIVVSRDRKKAVVVAARGPNIGNGQTLPLEDPLSPLAQCFSKVQSWGNKESQHSPFGSKSFALSPIDADHDTPVALYADCGNDSTISFEARRVFRTVVGILNEKLPQIPGGIPIELS